MKKIIFMLFICVFVSVFNLSAMEMALEGISVADSEMLLLNIALVDAIKRGDLEAVSSALDHGVDVNFSLSVEGEDDQKLINPLVEAVKRNNLYSQNYKDIIDVLLAREANPNIVGTFQNEEVMTPLFIATLKSDKLTAKKLLDHGSQLFCIDGFGEKFGIESMLMRENNSLMLRFFMDNGLNINKKLLEAAEQENEDVARFLLQNGADVNVDDPVSGSSLLTWACFYANEPFAKMLVQYGADVNKPDNAGRTPLMLAAQSGKLDLVEYLVKCNADILKRDVEGYTALMDACIYGYLDVVDYLADRGVLCDDKATDGITTLMAAALSGSLPIVKYLLDHNVNKDAQDNRGRTALTYAAINDHLPIFQMLQEAGLDKHHKSTKGKDMLMYAAKNGRMSVVSWLLFDGFNIHARDYRYRTALQIADQERKSIIEQLEDERRQVVVCQYDIKEIIKEVQNATNIVKALKNPEGYSKRNRKLFNDVFRKPTLSKFTKGYNVVKALQTRSLGQRILKKEDRTEDTRDA